MTKKKKILQNYSNGLYPLEPAVKMHLFTFCHPFTPPEEAARAKSVIQVEKVPIQILFWFFFGGGV